MDSVSSSTEGTTAPLQGFLVAHRLRPYWSKEKLPREQQLAWKLAQLATDDAPLDYNAVAMVKNRIIDNAGVAVASLNRRPVAVAREMALSCPVGKNGVGALIYGVESSLRVAPAWAAWANGTAVRELDFHDTYLAADYSHPGDNIPPILAVAQSVSKNFNIDGMRFIAGILTAYEVQVALVRAISLHKHAIDHIAHLCPAMAAGICTMLRLPIEKTYQAIQQALHVSLSTRQSRKGEISSWKAFAPAHAGKLAIEAVDRAMRGEGGPSPIYEGEDAIIAQVLDGMDASYVVKLPEPGKSKLAILETYTKEHSAEYQAQALIDLAFDMRKEIDDFSAVESILIETSHHTHKVIGTGSGDPQKFDPKASRETLDHSIMYIFAVAMLDGKWHHEDSYAPEKAQANETVELWQKISTVEKPEWTQRYHEVDPQKKAFGARVIVTMKDGKTVAQERALANAHPAGKTPFIRENYVKKFVALTKTLLADIEAERFIEAVDECDGFGMSDFDRLNPTSGAIIALETKGII